MDNSDYKYISDYDASVINEISILSGRIKEINTGLKQFMDSLSTDKKSAVNDVSNRLKLAGNNTNLITAIFSSSSADSSDNEKNTYLNSCFSSLTSYSRQMTDLLNGYYTNLKSRNEISDISAYTDEFESVLKNVSSISGDISITAGNFNDGFISENISVPDIPSRKEYMVYDSQTGLKHYMIYLLSLLDKCGIKYNMIAGRRYALDVSGNHVEGDAFVRKSRYDVYQTLDSDGNIYWFSNNSSRHYYGEAVDIIPKGITYSELIESLCTNDSIMDMMHQFGLSVQMEKLEAGAGKGEHLCISTLGGDTAVSWWKIVNQIRSKHNLTTYTVILQSSYMSEEIKNPIIRV